MSTSAIARPRHGQINLYEAGDYPIILGDSLKDNPAPKSRFLHMRYNWEPRAGFDNHKGVLKQSGDDVQLAYHEEGSGSGSPRYSYDGYISSATSTKEGKESSRLVLVFDEAKSAFVLERITASIDVNVTNAPKQTKDDLRRHRQLRRSASGDSTSNHKGQNAANDTDEDLPDPSNPYDFRHFIVEAKEAAEKVSQPGNGTPVPGNRTPMSGLGSPQLGAGRSAGTPSFRPTATTTHTHLKNKPSLNNSKASSSNPSRKPAPSKRKDASTTKTPTSQVLSKERVSDSDDEVDMSDTITVATKPPPKSQSHVRNKSSSGNSISNSPHIVVNDGGLEIDMGSPPRRPARRTQIDTGVFMRSQTHTPLAGASRNRNTTSHVRDEDSQMKDAEHERRIESSDASVDEDDDIEDLNLDSPHSHKVDNHAHHLQPHSQPPDAAPTPDSPPANIDDDEDDDAALAAELEAALVNQDDEDDDGDAMMGGGAGGAYGDDDESEVSEEE